MDIEIKIGIGEAIDRITILQIKADKITDEKKIENIRREFDSLSYSLLPVPQHEGMEALFNDLMDVNTELWEVEDALRVMESQKDFGAEFVELARSVYKLNDERAAIKKKINELYNSEIVEEKSYK